jgi:hypothetical protein
MLKKEMKDAIIWVSFYKTKQINTWAEINQLNKMNYNQLKYIIKELNIDIYEALKEHNEFLESKMSYRDFEAKKEMVDPAK